MPVISSLNLTNQLPVNTYSASLLTSGSLVTDGLGNQIVFLDVSCSYANTASIQTSWERSSSYSSASTWSDSSSFSSASLTSSHFSPSAGSVTDAGPLTGSVSASGFGFTTDVEFNTFITSISSSMQQFNSLLAKLRSQGLIS